MSDILPKPFTREGLLALLEKHLSHIKKLSIKEEDHAGPGSSVHSSLSHLASPNRSQTQASSPATWATNSPNVGHGGIVQPASATDDTFPVGALGAPLQTPNGLAYVPQVAGQRRPLDMGDEPVGGSKRQHTLYGGSGMRIR